MINRSISSCCAWWRRIHCTREWISRAACSFARADHMPEEDLNLILTVAQATLGTIRGPLSKQLGSSAEGASSAAAAADSGNSRNNLQHHCRSLNFLTSTVSVDLRVDGREYAIYLGPNAVTPLPWINVMANPVFGSLVSESGSGCCWYGNSQSNRLTPWNNDPISDTSAEAIYIRDEDSGVFWTPTPLPVRELDAYRARHGQGYTEFEHNSHALGTNAFDFCAGTCRTEGPDTHPAIANQEHVVAVAATVRHGLFGVRARHGS